MKLSFNPLILLVLILVLTNSTVFSQIDPPGAGKSVPVQVSLDIIHLDHINMVDETFQVNAYLTQVWTDPRNQKLLDTGQQQLVINNTSQIEQLLGKTIWHPDLEFINASYSPEIIHEQLRIDSLGVTSYSKRVIVSCKTDLDFRHFPFDEQTFTIQLESYLYPNNEVNLISANTTNDFSINQTSLINWKIQQHYSEVKQVAYETLQGGLYSTIPEFSHLNFHIRASRKSGYYFWNVLIPFAILIFSTLFAYRLKKERTGVIYSLLLLMVMFQFSIGLQLPEVPYLTLLDAIIMLGYLVVFTMIVLITFKRKRT